MNETINIETVAIAGGTFTMGDGSDSDNSAHQVTLSSFHIGKYPVTQAQWREIAALPKVEIDINPDPSYFKGDTLPVERVNWFECVEACKRLSAATGEEWRLPTEAEWEMSCRAGKTDNKKPEKGDGWFCTNSDNQTHPVGEKKQNAWGLHDMHGNVWEWCQDWYDADYYSVSPTDNPQGPSDGAYRVLRGGSWFNNQGCARAVFRDDGHPGGRYHFTGFRLLVVRPPLNTEEAVREAQVRSASRDAVEPAITQPAGVSLEQQVKELRERVEWLEERQAQMAEQIGGIKR